jgi:hypothetical protein
MKNCLTGKGYLPATNPELAGTRCGVRLFNWLGGRSASKLASQSLKKLSIWTIWRFNARKLHSWSHQSRKQNQLFLNDLPAVYMTTALRSKRKTRFGKSPKPTRESPIRLLLRAGCVLPGLGNRGGPPRRQKRTRPAFVVAATFGRGRRRVPLHRKCDGETPPLQTRNCR